MLAKLIPIAFSAISMLAAIAAAQPNGTTRPAREGRGFGPFAMRREIPPKWEDVAAFFRENSPKRFDAFERLPEKDKPRFREFYNRLYMTVRGLERAGDTELATLKKGQIRVEDDIFGKRMALRADGLSDEQRSELQKELRELVRKRVETSLEERTARLVRMRKLLEQEEKQLEADRGKIDQKVEMQYQAELKSMPERGFPGRDGPHRFRRDDEKRPGREPADTK